MEVKDKLNIDTDMIKRIVSLPDSRFDAEIFLGNIPKQDGDTMLRILGEWDRGYFSNDVIDDETIIRPAASQQIKIWLQTASTFDVGMARKFLMYLNREKARRLKGVRSSPISVRSNQSMRSNHSSVALPNRDPRVKVIRPKPLSNRYTSRHDPSGMFYYQPPNPEEEDTSADASGIKRRTAKPHTTRRGIAMKIKMNQPDSEAVETQRSARSKHSEEEDDNVVPYFPLRTHHKTRYRDPAEVQAEEEAQQQEERKEAEPVYFPPPLAHHKFNYMSLTDIKRTQEEEKEEGKDGEEYQPPPLRVAHHRTLYGHYEDPRKRKFDEQGGEVSARVAHHKSLYGQIAQPKHAQTSPPIEEEANLGWPSNTAYHKQFYEPPGFTPEPKYLEYSYRSHHLKEYKLAEDNGGGISTNTVNI